MPNYGKIARLPRNLRDELNHRIDNGEMGVRLVEWLNGLPEVKQVLQTHFPGREISEQNLTEWKANGYLHWQAQQEALARARELNANATELAAESGGGLAEPLATLVAARYAIVLDPSNGQITDETLRNLRGLKGICREVARLRRGDQVVQRMKIQRERLALDRQKTKAEIRSKAEASALNKRRFEHSKSSAEVKAMQFCLDQTRGYPEVQELFKQAFAAFEKATAGK